ncbi:MAG: hypothetical protein ACRCYQ_10990 [Nocardioides sp.]
MRPARGAPEDVPGRRARYLLGLAGVVLGAYGVWLLIGRPDDLLAVAVWFGGGVIAHDVVLAPLVIGACAVGAAALPAVVRRVATIWLIVFGTVTVLAVPVLGRFGARADNPTLLDRQYLLGWLAIGVVTMAGSVLAGSVLAGIGGAGHEQETVMRETGDHEAGITETEPDR